MFKALKILGQKHLELSKNYLLVGDSDFLYLHIKEQIVKNLDEKTELFLFDCSDKSDKIESLVNAIGSQDLFSTSKFIIIKNINKLSKKNKETVISLINSEKIHRILCVDHSFLTYDYKSKSNIIKSAISREFQKYLDTIDISTPFESEMKQWIKIFADELNLDISNTYSSKLIETFGNNFSAIYNEMSKSSLSFKKGDSLMHLLEQSSSVKKDKQLWELNYAICDRKVDAIFENGLSILNQYGLSYLINSMFTIIEAIFLTKKNNGTLLESASRNIKGKVINRISSASSNYSFKELENAIVTFSKIDIKLKTQKVIDEAEFTNIINGVFRIER
jgi:DNA polymerase III delta subunit